MDDRLPPGELDPVVQPAWLQHVASERLKELRLGRGLHIQAVCDAVGGDVVKQAMLERRRIVAVVEGPAPAKKSR